jgi:hypothetical protein
LLGENISSWSPNHIWCVDALNCQLVRLSVCLADEIMGYTGIEENDDMVTVERESTHEDMSALGNILHGGVVHSTGLGNNSRRMARMTLRSRHVHLPWCHTHFDEMTNNTIVIAGVGNYAQLL